MLLFNRSRVRQNKSRAVHSLDSHDFLLTAVQEQLLERLQDIKKNFSSILMIGGVPQKAFSTLSACPQTQGSSLILGDWSFEWLTQFPSLSVTRVLLEDTHLPFQNQSFDLILNLFSLHWIQEVPKALGEFKRVLKPEGVLLSAFLGGETLKELRECLLKAELALTKGASLRVAPMIDLPTASALLQKTGFSLPMADRDVIRVTYPSLKKLCADLKGMGEGNGLQIRPPATPKSLFEETEKLYKSHFSTSDNRLSATFEVIYLTGWSETSQ